MTFGDFAEHQRGPINTQLIFIWLTTCRLGLVNQSTSPMTSICYSCWTNHHTILTIVWWELGVIFYHQNVFLMESIQPTKRHCCLSVRDGNTARVILSWVYAPHLVGCEISTGCLPNGPRGRLIIYWFSDKPSHSSSESQRPAYCAVARYVWQHLIWIRCSRPISL